VGEYVAAFVLKTFIFYDEGFFVYNSNRIQNIVTLFALGSENRKMYVYLRCLTPGNYGLNVVNWNRIKFYIMKAQNYKNHRRWVFAFHGVTFFAIIALLIGSIRNLLVTEAEDLYPSVLLVLIAFILVFLFFFSRGFALKAQDRALKAEEMLRYYILTGRTLPEALTTRQIIGLRFASDEEFVELVDRAVQENLSEEQIKKAIKNWKADNYRV
jgi:hypothetical protein